MCGDQNVRGVDFLKGGGSSLRVRGTGPGHQSPEPFHRVIPACAKTNRLSELIHNRVSSSDPAALRMGCAVRRHRSEPVQGCQSLDLLTHMKKSPAMKSSTSPTGTRYRTGHPCVCGEQRVQAVSRKRPAGSSLRVRGTAHGLKRVAVIDRGIPACAGNISTSCWRRGLRPGHPCVCGEQAATSTAAAAAPRIIPACAGNRATRPRSRPSGHPCVCGEQVLVVPPGQRRRGSSLRVRGTVRDLSAD